jgi:hypothetical protein
LLLAGCHFGQQERQRGDDEHHRHQPPEDQAEALRPLTVLYTNAQSVFNKIDELNVTAADEQPDLILLTETWCGPHITNAELTVAGYQIETELRRDRTDTTAGIGGGLLVYSKLGIKLRPTNKFKDSTFNQFIEFEIIAEKPIKMLLVYRPPSSGPDNIQELCKIMRNLDKETIVVGDFNLPEINWEDELSGARGRPVLEAAADQQLVQMVTFATHTKGNTLDLLIVNCPERILTINSTGRLGRSDHEMLKMELLVNNWRGGPTNSRPMLNWKRANYDGMKDYLYTYTWAINAESGVNEDWLEFKTVMLKLVEEFIPASKVR